MFVDYRIERWCSRCEAKIKKADYDGRRCPNCGTLLRNQSKDRKRSIRFARAREAKETSP